MKGVKPPEFVEFTVDGGAIGRRSFGSCARVQPRRNVSGVYRSKTVRTRATENGVPDEVVAVGSDSIRTWNKTSQRRRLRRCLNEMRR